MSKRPKPAIDLSGVDDLPDGYHYYGNPPKVTLDGGNIQVSKPSRPDKGTIAETYFLWKIGITTIYYFMRNC